MSVSDPLIRDIKGSVIKFLDDIQDIDYISDDNPNLLPFCENVEKVFTGGLSPTQNIFGFAKQRDPWIWLENISTITGDLIPYHYKAAVDGVRRYESILNSVGKLRLLIRHCLFYKSLHVPVQYLIKYDKNRLYKENCILGDEILLEIFVSIVLQCNKLRFNLDLSNVSFLNESWLLPNKIKLELVPCTNLGISVSFAGNKAIIMKIQSSSVIYETSKVEVGDVLDNLNGVHICMATKGKLNAILKNAKGHPVTIQIIKARLNSSNKLFQPIISLLKQVHIDPDTLKHDLQSAGFNAVVKKETSAGFKVIYVGCINIGNNGEVKQIDKAVRMLLSYPMYHNQSTSTNLIQKQLKINVHLEVGEIGVKVLDAQSSEIILKHSYMEIASCGSISYMPHYFAYIAGNEYCDQADEFICHVFYIKNTDMVYTILQSIGQGFQRTHFVV